MHALDLMERGSAQVDIRESVEGALNAPELAGARLLKLVLTAISRRHACDE